MKLTFLTLLLLIPQLASSYFVLAENFFSPTPFPPEGWSTYYEGRARDCSWEWSDEDQTGNGYAWGYIYCYGGSDQWGVAELHSKTFSLFQNSECVIRFLNKSSWYYYPEQVSADFRLMKGSTVLEIWPIPNFGSTNYWEMVEVSFSPVPSSGNDYYMIFRITGESSGFATCEVQLRIDDLFVEEIPSFLQVNNQTLGKLKAYFR